MCPSEIYELPLQNTPSFGRETQVFQALDFNPCSIMLKDVLDTSDIRIQVKTDISDWKDYEEGDLIIGKTVMCRMASGSIGIHDIVKIEVFHT
jgi:glutaredoxin-related protein